jgi:outer membrane protein
MKMEKLLALALAGACGVAAAQTPSSNPMPDGSRDTYVGLGAVTTPVYEGSDGRRVRALPVLQAAWSNGIFVSGLSAGMHLSGQPSIEFGPLLAIQQRRTESGLSNNIGAVLTGADTAILPGVAEPSKTLAFGNRLTGMDVQHTRLQAGGFFNYYLNPQLRLTSSLLYGSGNERDGGLLRIGAQYLAGDIAPHHFLSLGIGATVANRSHNQAFFGVSRDEAARGGINPAYAASGGVKDVHLNLRWNWSFTPSWLLTSGAQVSRLQGSAKDSPLALRPTNVTVSTALAYRF